MLSSIPISHVLRVISSHTLAASRPQFEIDVIHLGFRRQFTHIGYQFDKKMEFRGRHRGPVLHDDPSKLH
jgi:hypothetical protein